MIKEQIREQLKQMADEDYKKFSKKIVPGVDNMFGIRLPKLRETAKKIAKVDADGYLQQLEEVLASGGEVYYEEIMLYGLVIGYARWDDEKRTVWLERFMKYIDNWAVCDSCCMTYKWMKKNPEYWWAYLIRQIKKNQEYTIRFAFVCMLAHFVDEDHVEEILSWCERIRHEGYYVKMAAAWAVSSLGRSYYRAKKATRYHAANMASVGYLSFRSSGQDILSDHSRSRMPSYTASATSASFMA